MGRGRRYNCVCGKKRYRDEPAALAAAAADEEAFGGAVAVYRCPGGLAWHLSAHGFTPEALRSVGRRLAFELVDHGRVELVDFEVRVLGADPRRWARLQRCAEQMTGLGLTRRVAEGTLAVADPVGLLRVVQVGLDGYADETDPAAQPGGRGTGSPGSRIAG